MESLRSRIGLLLFFYLTGCLGANTGQAAGVESFHWGLTLEALTQVLAKEGRADSLLREDPNRASIELPLTPLKSLKIPRGRLKAVIEAKQTAGPESLGRLYGYVYDGLLFGRVELFKQTPSFSVTEITRGLKERFPEGKVFRSLSGPKPVSYFEYRGNDLYVFTNAEGVYYFEPFTLNKVIREEQQAMGEKETKIQEEFREQSRTP
jgi:hypothetical protein